MFLCRKRLLQRRPKVYIFEKSFNLNIFFKVKYNPRAVLGLVREAMDVFKRKKEQYDGRCWHAFEKAKSISPFARKESYVTLFLFRTLPNASFGIANDYLDPPQDPCGTLYLHPRHKDVTFTGLHLSKMTKHFIQSESRVMQYPPLGSLFSYFSFCFFDFLISY